MSVYVSNRGCRAATVGTQLATNVAEHFCAASANPPFFVAVEVGLRHFYTLIPIEVCAADYIIADYECQPYFEYDKPMRIGYRYKPGLHFEGVWDPANPYLASAGDSTAPTDRDDAFWYVFRTDEMGFPNSEYEWRDHYDMVISGDSFVTRTAPKTWIELLVEKSGQSILTLGASS
ncbi:MAG TPA: hypothetical protein VF177_14105 [Anaerolineae bacterium]